MLKVLHETIGANKESFIFKCVIFGTLILIFNNIRYNNIRSAILYSGKSSLNYLNILHTEKKEVP